MLLWNQVDALQAHFKKDHVHMRLWTRLYSIDYSAITLDDIRTGVQGVQCTYFLYKQLKWLN